MTSRFVWWAEPAEIELTGCTLLVGGADVDGAERAVIVAVGAGFSFELALDAERVDDFVGQLDATRQGVEPRPSTLRSDRRRGVRTVVLELGTDAAAGELAGVLRGLGESLREPVAGGAL
ncbi:hypothetical protein [Nocardia sp. BMG51109]|uniref:hypothetical protein n=1 Tax=Nocardia sp. BMG51109 TaxID=1056816 RepID=UPI000466B7ED|nr:hypothetical protein [Nocardia sp. BMG51109]